MNEQDNHDKVIIAGPTRVGKSTALDMLEEVNPHIERGKKYKHRFIGGPWPDDGQKKDSIIVTEKEANQLIREGKIAFDYRTADTWHLVDLEDAVRRDRDIVYISDSHRGAMLFKQFFRHLKEYSKDPITFLFYTNPELIKNRLIASNIPDEQIRLRLQTFENEFAIFKQNSPEYLFLLSIRSPPIDRTVFLDEAARAEKRAEIMAEAHSVISLIDAYRQYFRPGVSYVDIHRAFVNEKSMKLVGSDLQDLGARLLDTTVKIDFSSEIAQYKQARYIPKEILTALENVVVMNYSYINGRHSILLRGMVNPLNEPPQLPEDRVLDLIRMRIGEPTQRKVIKGQGYLPQSDFGLFKLENGGLFRDGVSYSLGDQLVDDTHVSLNIGFLYSRRQPVRVIGYTLTDLYQRGRLSDGIGSLLLHKVG